MIEHDEPSAIVVTKERSRAVRTSYVHQMVQQQLESWLQLAWQRHSVDAKQNREMNIKICRVTMVVTRLFEIDAIGFDVSRQLRDENFET